MSAAVDAVDEEALELLAACTKGWRGIGEEAEIAFSAKAAAALYRKYKWIYEQVDAAVHTRANFLPGGAGSSSRSPATSST
jgi:predicted TPR repeat methyltransferase